MQDFDYEKHEYDVTLTDGRIVRCWPNAGVWHALNGSGKVYTMAEVVAAEMVRYEDAEGDFASLIR